MAGKISDAEKNLKFGNKLSSITVKISSSKSIFSYQNGSTMNNESCEGISEETVPENGYPEKSMLFEEPFSQDQDIKNECLDLLRKKLISELSLTVFSSDLENKLAKVEPIDISKERQSIIQKLLVQISQLSDAEKLLLYLKLPSSTNSPFDPLRQPLNPLGNRQEIQQTIVWIKTHLEEDSEISIPKQDVYDQYLKYCKNVSMKPLSTADFGKVMKQVYPGVRPRRLGTRGNSRYCYSGMRNTCKLPTPILTQSSTEFSTSGDSSNNILDSSSTVESTKCRKIEKQKRKWKPSCRSGQCNNFYSSNSATDKDPASRNLKRTKVEDTGNENAKFKEAESKGDDPGKSQESNETVQEDTVLGVNKCEENSDNSFCAPDERELDKDFGVCLKNEENIFEFSPTRRGLMNFSPSRSKSGENEIDVQRISRGDKNSGQKLRFEQNRSCSEGNIFSVINGDQSKRVGSHSNHITNKIIGPDEPRNNVPDQRKPGKNKTRRSASLTKAPKNLRKNYVPIQPKPVESPKLNFQFEQLPGVNQFSYDQKKESEGLILCEENDSQEPEEEIVRYFQHLDENEVITDSVVDQAVKNMDTNTVQINSISHIVCNNSGNCRTGSDILNQGGQPGLRSQSCFEVQRKLFNFGDSVDSVYVPRSQSSVELPVSNEPAHSEGLDSDCDINGKSKRISHLRILLEKSITSRNSNSYPSSKINSPVSLGPSVTNVQIADSVMHSAPQDSNCSYSQVKPIDRDVKILRKGPTHALQSPSNRTKYFSFTPISPGPQSPLKTPTTPSASPFVSPRDTPVPRPRQNSNCDTFLSPSERKSFSFRPENKIKNDSLNENVLTFSKTILGNFRAEGYKDPVHLKASPRPRSFSSTNFCRAKAQRNAAKMGGYGQMNNTLLKNGVQIKPQNNFVINSPFSIHKNFVTSIEDSLSSEVQRFLENHSKFSDRSATIRSQSVPLNKMISESTWMPNQVPSAYSSDFDSGLSNATLASVPGKFLEWVSSSNTNSPEEIAANISPFLMNRDVNNIEHASFGSDQVFQAEPAVGQFGDQYFTSSFQAGNEGGFPENDPFHEESAFSSKLELHSNENFDGGFTNEPDPVIADNIKSYLPDFGSLESEEPKSDESEKKLFKNAMYERAGDNLMDPVITSFKPVLTNELASCPGSPVLNFFGTKISEDNQQLIELFDFED